MFYVIARKCYAGDNEVYIERQTEIVGLKKRIIAMDMESFTECKPTEVNNNHHLYWTGIVWNRLGPSKNQKQNKNKGSQMPNVASIKFDAGEQQWDIWSPTH